jgi:hypothetical protein
MPEEATPDDQLPGALAKLDDKIEVQIRPASGNRSPEIHARVRGTVGTVPSGLSGVRTWMSGEDLRRS